jgi:hypothetical protein
MFAIKMINRDGDAWYVAKFTRTGVVPIGTHLPNRAKQYATEADARKDANNPPMIFAKSLALCGGRLEVVKI